MTIKEQITLMEASTLLADSQILLSPSVPKPTSLRDVLPDESSEREIARAQIERQSFRLFCPNSIRQGSDSCFWPLSELASSLNPSFPDNLQLSYRLFWHRLHPSVILPPTANFSQTYELQSGMTIADQRTMSAQYGVGICLLSDKLSSTLNLTITISDQTTISKTVTENGDPNHIVMLTLWQLKEAYVVVDETGRPSSYDGRCAVISGPAYIYGLRYMQPLDMFVDRQLFSPD
jgi:hypothetical protein